MHIMNVDFGRKFLVLYCSRLVWQIYVHYFNAEDHEFHYFLAYVCFQVSGVGNAISDVAV